MRRRLSLLAAACLVAVVAVAWVATARPWNTEGSALGFDEWSTRQTAAAAPVVDASGGVWSPAGGRLVGGRLEVAAASVQATASPQLYQPLRVGLRTWSVPVPAPGRYAVDLLVRAPGGRLAEQPTVFDVLQSPDDATGTATSSTLGRVSLGPGDRGQARHLIGWAHVTRQLRLTFRPVQGLPSASGLAVTSAGPAAGARTVFHDDFSGPAGSMPAASWRHAIGSGPWGDQELQAYTADPQNGSLDGRGHLIITARRQDFADAHGRREYTSARLTTQGTVSFSFGRVEARVKVPSGQGLWPAFWALGDNIDKVDWPRAGELDVMEYLGGDPSAYWASIHSLGDAQDKPGWKNQPVSVVSHRCAVGTRLSDGFHVFSADVQPGAVGFSLDGQRCFVAAREDLRPGQQWPFDHSFYLLVNLAVGGTWGGPPNASTIFPSSVAVDYVRVSS